MVFNQFRFVHELSEDEANSFWDDEFLIKDGKTCRFWSLPDKHTVVLDVVYNLESVSILNLDTDFRYC